MGFGGIRKQAEFVQKGMRRLRSQKCPLCSKEYFGYLAMETHLINGHKLHGEEKHKVMSDAGLKPNWSKKCL